MQSPVPLPTTINNPQFDAKLQALVTKESGGGYEVADKGGETQDALAFNAAGDVTELRAPGYASVEYDYEGGDLAEIAVDDPATAGGAMAAESKPSFGSFTHAASFGGEPSGPGHLWRPFDLAAAADGSVWVADTAHNRLQEFGPDGEYVRQFGSFGSGKSQFSEPRGIAIDAEGDLWVADTRNNRIQEYTSSGDFIRKVGSEGTAAGQFAEPFGIAIDKAGNVWVSDTNNSRVQEFNAKGEFIRQLGTKGSANSQFSFPEGVATDAENNIWVADMGNSRIQKFNAKGEFIRKFGSEGTGNGQFRRPSGVAIAPDGTLWVADSRNNRVQRFSANGEYLAQFGTGGINDGQFFEPQGVSVDASGSVLIADTYNNRVQKISGTEYLRQFGGQGAGQLLAPTDVAVDPSGNTWVADNGQNRIQEFNSKGELLRQFGGNGAGDGQFVSPRSVAIDPAGNLLVADSGNRRIQKFDSEGKFISKFGTSGTGDGQFSGLLAIACDSNGNIWTTESNGVSVARVQEFNAKGEFIRKFGSIGKKGEPAEGVFRSPIDVAIDSSGKVWVVDAEYSRVQQFSAEGKFLRQAGAEGTGNGQYLEPRGIAFDPEGNIWITDKGNNRAEVFSSAGVYLSQIGAAGGNEGQFFEPSGLASDSQGNVWIADTGNNRVQEVSGSEFRLEFGGEATGPGQLSRSNAIATDAEGNVWAADTGYNRIQEFDPEGKFLRMFGSFGTGDGQFYLPQGIATDSKGSVWVADTNHHRVEQFDSKGNFKRKVGTSGAGNGQLNLPSGLAVDASDNLWVADTGNNRIQEFSAEGASIRTIGTAGSGNGQMNGPKDVAVSNGTVWVADTGNNRIEAFSVGGKFIRVFGSKGEGSGQLNAPAGVAVDASGTVLVSDTGNNRIEAFTSTGTFLGQLGETGPNPGQLNGPTDVVSSSAGDVWVADAGSSKLEKWSPAPPVEPEAAIEVNTPGGLVSSIEGDGIGTYSYQHEGDRLTSAAGPQGETKYEYDAAERLTKVTLPNGTWGKAEYEAAGRVKSVTISVEGAKAKTTQFEYQDEPSRRTTVTPEAEPVTVYDVGVDGSVIKWHNAVTPPEIEELTGSLWTQRGEVHPEPISIGDQTLLVQAHSEEGISSIQVVANGSQIVAEKTCTQDPEKAGIECKTEAKELVTNTEAWPPGILQLEVLATDRLNHVASQRFWVNIPYTPPPGSEAPDPPTFADILHFREEYGLDLDLNGNEFAQNERIFELISSWHNPNTPDGEIARATADRWGVPLRAVDAAELEYRERYIAQDGPIIEQWGNANVPNSYAGYYVDHRAGGVIRVGFTGPAAQRAELIAQLKSLSGLLAVERMVPFASPPVHSLAELRTLRSEVGKYRSSHSGVAQTINRTGIDVGANAVSVGASDVAGVTAALQGAFGAGAPISVYFDDERIEPKGGRFRASGPLEAGDGIGTPYIHACEDGTGKSDCQVACTAAFGAKDPVTVKPNGEPLNAYFTLTAGHCFKPGESVYRMAAPEAEGKDLIKVGQVKRSSLLYRGGGLGGVLEADAEAIRMENANVAPNWTFLSSVSAQKIGPAGFPETGKTVCLSGASSRRVSCGPVTGEPEEAYYEEEERGTTGRLWLVPMNVYGVHGDSGSPVWDLYTGDSVGMLSGGPANDDHKNLIQPLTPWPGHESEAPGALNMPEMAPLRLLCWQGPPC